MKTMLFAGLAMTVGLGAATAATAQDDDWEFQQDPAHNIAIAAARYDAGQMIVVQCRDNKLTAVLTGLPQSTEPLHVAATRADGRSAEQTFVPAGAPGTWRSVAPARAVRFLKGGGLYSVRTEEGAETPFRGSYDLPTQSANLDRVLAACGWATEDDRDALAQAPISVDDPQAHHRTPTRRGPTSRSPRREIEMPDAPPPPVPEQEISCIVRDMHLTDCRAVYAPSAQTEEVLTTLRFAEGRQVYALEDSTPAEAEGRVYYVRENTYLLRVVRR